jgi:hypothetical protein
VGRAEHGERAELDHRDDPALDRTEPLMFAAGSRYLAAGSPYLVTLPDGSQVLATPLPLPQPEPVLGYHPPKSTDRLDLLAFRYLNDATAFWRICDTNNAMVAGTLTSRSLIAIPVSGT